MPDQCAPPIPNSKFPAQIILNGADNFLLQLDNIMLRSSGQGNVCTFVVALQEQLELAVLEFNLADNPAYRWITRLRLRKGFPFSLAKWVVDSNAELPEIKQYQIEADDKLPSELLAKVIAIKNESPFKIDLIQVADAGSYLVFSWHHALMDAHGGESFVHLLTSKHALNQQEWVKHLSFNRPLKERAQIAREMKQFLYDTSQLPLLSLFKTGTIKPTQSYRILSFTQQQSGLISDTARQHGAGFLLSALYLAATASAIAAIKKQRGPLNGDVLVPVPLDRRLKGARGPIIGNQVSFLFYRIPKQNLSNLQDCTVGLTEQMKNLIRSENPGHYLIMMDFLRRVPGIIYRLMLKAPTEGLMASFSFSDTGELPDFEQLFGQTMNSATHYPPNLYPPGMTFIFSRFRGCLQMTFAYTEDIISVQEVDQLMLQIRSALLGKSGN